MRFTGSDRRTRSPARGPSAAPAPQHDQRIRSAYIFGAIYPKEGKGAGLVLPRCSTQAMTLHLAEISKAVNPRAHGVVLLDQAGWHGSKDLDTVCHRRLQLTKGNPLYGYRT